MSALENLNVSQTLRVEGEKLPNVSSGTRIKWFVSHPDEHSKQAKKWAFIAAQLYFLQTLHSNCKFPSRNELHQKEALIKAFENITPREVLLNLTVAKFTNLTLEL